MARIDDLVAQVSDKSLRLRLDDALSDLKRRRRFGLVFEEHIPETAALLRFPIQQGATVQRRDDKDGKQLYTVKRLIGSSRATVEPEKGGAEVTFRHDELLVVKRFGDPIFPALTPIGSTPAYHLGKPFHAVINGENFHALQLFVYLYEGQVDCIYIDPPYNTGAKDWKYNNRYVDNNDAWRHSKWLSFMEKRLSLAKRLLKPDGILIVTIDEHEVHHLGMLLERNYADAYRQMVTIVINPKGVTQGRFSRVDEYAFFCFRGKSTAIGVGDDLLSPGGDEEETLEEGEDRRPRWKGLLRSGTNARRRDRKKMFFPVLIDEKRSAVLGAGEPLPFEKKPDFKKKIDGLTPVWPIRNDGSLGNWGVGATTLRQLIAKGYVALGEFDKKRKTWALSYLSKQPQEQIASGVLAIKKFDKKRNVVDVVYSAHSTRRLKTVWHRSRHDAGVGGTDVLRDLLGGRPFSFPKSVYAVYDCLAAVLRDRKDALVMDFFAGSGTTLHATALLNAADDGARRCILVTNNELEGETAAQLHKRGLFRGDSKFEANGIFEMVTRPRCEAVITGRRKNGVRIPGEHIDGRPYKDGFRENVEFFRIDYLDPDEVDLGNQFSAIFPSLWLASGGIGRRPKPSTGIDMLVAQDATYAVLFREEKFSKFRKTLEGCPQVRHIWLVTDSEDAFSEMRASLPAQVKVSMLYRDYLRNFRINTRHNL